MVVEAEIRELDRRVSSLKKSNDGLRTTFIKLVPIVEETRLRVSKIEDDVSEIKQDLRSVRADVNSLKSDVNLLKSDFSSLRKELPGMVADAMREVLREK